MLKTIIVEDEVASQEALRNYLLQYCADVEVLDVANDINEGKKLIEEHQPDLVFLDVEMPFGNGFDLLESLDQISFHFISYS